MHIEQEDWRRFALERVFYHVTDIFRQGDSPQAVWFINSGEVKLVRLESEGQELIYNLRSEGRWLGLSSAIRQRPYEFTATPLTTCRALRLPLWTFHQLLKADPGFASLVAQELAVNLIELNEFPDRVSRPRHAENRNRIPDRLA